MTIHDADHRQHVEQLFEQAAFVRHLGITLKECGQGWCVAHMPIEPHHLQQDGVVHAGVLATLNDHTCGGAAMTLLGPSQSIVSVEFQNNMLRAARGQRLEARAEVLKPGRTIHVVEAKCWSIDEHEHRTLVSSMTCTLMVLQATLT